MNIWVLLKKWLNEEIPSKKLFSYLGLLLFLLLFLLLIYYLLIKIFTLTNIDIRKLIIFLFPFGFLYVFTITYLKSLKNKNSLIRFIVNGYFFQYINGILVTFIGILFAIYFTNITTKEDNRIKTMNLLIIVIYDLKNIKAEYSYFLSQVTEPKDGIDLEVYEVYKEIMVENYIVYPYILNEILKNNIVLANISLNNYYILLTHIHFLEYNINAFNEAKTLDEKVRINKLLIDYINIIAEIILNELEYLNGSITFEKMIEKNSEISRKKTIDNN
jgi:hypothetical protein